MLKRPDRDGMDYLHLKLVSCNHGQKFDAVGIHSIQQFARYTMARCIKQSVE